MSFAQFLADDRQLSDRLRAAAPEGRGAMIDAGLDAGRAALAAAASLAEQVEITMRLAATSALGAAESGSADHARAAMLWAGRCSRMLRGAAAEAHYLPRLASLVGGISPLLDDDLKRVAAAGLSDWARRSATALETVLAAEQDGDAYARAALAADEVAGAEHIADAARQRAGAEYAAAGRPDLGRGISR